MDSFIKKIFERNPTLYDKLFFFLMKNDFPFFKVSSIADQPKIKNEIFQNYLKNNDTLFDLVKKHSKRIEKKKNFKLNLLSKSLQNIVFKL
jgi:hypothetical protein